MTRTCKENAQNGRELIPSPHHHIFALSSGSFPFIKCSQHLLKIFVVSLCTCFPSTIEFPLTPAWNEKRCLDICPTSSNSTTCGSKNFELRWKVRHLPPVNFDRVFSFKFIKVFCMSKQCRISYWKGDIRFGCPTPRKLPLWNKWRSLGQVKSSQTSLHLCALTVATLRLSWTAPLHFSLGGVVGNSQV